MRAWGRNFNENQNIITLTNDINTEANPNKIELKWMTTDKSQESVKAYVLLKCWNANTMPYVIHSNYIAIPENTDNIFIWVRRNKNIFDLKIENLTKGE